MAISKIVLRERFSRAALLEITHDHTDSDLTIGKTRIGGRMKRDWSDFISKIGPISIAFEPPPNLHNMTSLMYVIHLSNRYALARGFDVDFDPAVDPSIYGPVDTEIETDDPNPLF